MDIRIPADILESAFLAVRKDFDRINFQEFYTNCFEEFLCGMDFLTSHALIKRGKSETFSLNILESEKSGVPGHIVTVRCIANVDDGEDVYIMNGYFRGFFPLEKGEVKLALMDVLRYFALWRKDKVRGDLSEFSKYFKTD